MQTTRDDALFSEIHRLVTDCLEGIASAETVGRLDALVANDPAARRLYLEYLRDSIGLRYVVSHSNDAFASGDFSVSGLDAAMDEPMTTCPPLTSPVSDVSHGLLPTVFDHFASGWPTAYLVATLLLGVALLVGSWVTVNRYVGKDQPGIVNRESMQGDDGLKTDLPVVVAHITELANCKWSVVSGQWPEKGSGGRDQGTGVTKAKDLRPKSLFLGDRLIVSSGLMQITYDSGARVILEGPCRYKVDSQRGGYLAVGKLTAKVEKGSGARGPGSGNANHSPLSSLPSPLFAVRTPMAVVTDLGTEFGVEVEPSGATRSHVFQGSVELRVSNSRRSTTSGELAEILHAGESACVERGRNRKVTITRELGQPSRFVRQIPASCILHPSSLGNRHQSLIPNPFYRLTDLGTLGGKTSYAGGINTSGQIIGESMTAHGKVHAFLYADGKMQDLGTLIPGGISTAHDINASGQVVGITSSGNAGYSRAFLYSQGVMKELGTLGGRMARAYAINDEGSVVGYSRNAQGVQRAFLYTPGKEMQDLGSLGGPNAMSQANDINSAGLVVGVSATSRGIEHAFLYVPGVGMKDLGTLGGKRSHAYAINTAGQIAGLSDATTGITKAFFYSNDAGMKQLGALDNKQGWALDVNNHDQVVGFVNSSDINELSHAFLYQDGKMYDLNSCIKPSMGWTLLIAASMNDSGQIVGYGSTPDGRLRAFMLTPVKRLGARD